MIVSTGTSTAQKMAPPIRQGLTISPDPIQETEGGRIARPGSVWRLVCRIPSARHPAHHAGRCRPLGRFALLPGWSSPAGARTRYTELSGAPPTRGNGPGTLASEPFDVWRVVSGRSSAH